MSPSPSTLTIDPSWAGLPNTAQYRRLMFAVDPSGDAPSSRYGTRAERWAPFAVAVLYISEYHSGGYHDFELQAAADEYASQVVNDSPNPALTILDYWHTLPVAIRRAVGGKRHVRDLANDAW